MENISLTKRIDQLPEDSRKIIGISQERFIPLYELFLNRAQVLNKTKKNLFLFNNEIDALNFYNGLKVNSSRTFYFPGLEQEIYSSIIQSDLDFSKRIEVLSELECDSINIVSTLAAARLKLPPKEFLTKEKLVIEVNEIYEREKLIETLVNFGYKRAINTDEPGTFAVKGEIFDIYPIGSDPIRINFFDTLVESISFVDPVTLKTLKDRRLDIVEIKKTGDSIFTKENLINFKNKFPRPKLNERPLFEQRNKIFESLNDGYRFENFVLYTSYFFNNTTCLLQQAKHFNTFIFDKENTEKDFELYIEELQESRVKAMDLEEIFISKPGEIFNLDHHEYSFLEVNEFDFDLDAGSNNKIKVELKRFPASLTKSVVLKEKIKTLILDAEKFSKEGFNLFLCSNSNYRVGEIKSYMDFFAETLFSKIKVIPYSLSASFFYPNEKLIFLSDNDFFTGKKIANRKKSQTINRDFDLFAEQISTLQKGDFVIHKNHGVGIYQGIESLTFGEYTSDYVVVEYKDSDKVYVPVYKLDLIQKYSTRDSNVAISDLKKSRFESAKAKARESVKKLAFSLIEEQAKRKLEKGFAFSEPDTEYNDFSLSFPYTETPDQAKAIDAVIEDMVSSRPMDRLICGDVGFGKTEVAIRAAFKAVLDSKQVAVLVPTTVLSFQHHNSFIERFKDFPVVVESISRLKTAKEVREIQEKVARGKIDILIGTHKILSSNFEFKDLGLLVIDEEQRFGVGHKEKLKLLKASVDTLTMTATPIPRTLQLSFLGIKELSLIKTPPPKRQSIKTYVIKEDKSTIRMAIEKELARNGQVFIVHNKVSDIEIFTSKIRELVPKAKIIFAHGQLPERELEKRIASFYKHQYDILISTTIIESGVDIPNANTMIIDRADTFGLSQLHQLRGRIGRSNKKAYAYFTIPKFKKLSEVSTKRLRALQTFAELGSGFSISSSDLEIRGAGDILGPEQSGHINNIGLELYMELLEDAMNEIKGNPVKLVHHVDVQTSFNAFIPEGYIESNSVRLKLYKQLSSVQHLGELEDKIESVSDQYGQLPTELLTLITLIKSKIILRNLGVEFVKVLTKSVMIKFNKALIDGNEKVRDKIVKFFTQRPKIYKINPDYSINCTFKDKITVNSYFDYINYLKENLE